MADDQQRFTAVYQRTHGVILAYASRRAPHDLAREATDEVFLLAWRKFDSIPTDPIPWLIVTARNVLSDLYRRDQRQDRLLDSLVRARMAVDHRGGLGADSAALERVVVLEATASLTDSDREILLLTVWDGLTHRQAAKVVGCSAATFSVRHHRARRRLEVALAEAAIASDDYPSQPSAIDRSTP